MNSQKATVLALTSAGMEISWRYAWSSFLTQAITQQPFPFPVALGGFITAVFFTRLSVRRNWRRFQAGLIHIAGFTLAGFLMTYRLFFKDFPFLSSDWLAKLIRQLQAPQQWFVLLPVFFCLLLFWLGGRRSEKIPRTYFPVCLQFDKGMGAFFLLLLIGFLIQLKGGLIQEDPATGLLVIAFFLFSLLSIGLARGQADAKKSFLTGYHGIGIILGFTTIVVICGAALVLLTFPYMTQIADSTHGVIKETVAPMGPILVRILRFIFGRARFGIETGTPGTVDTGSDLALPAVSGGWQDSVLQVISWGLVGMLGLGVIILVGYMIIYVVRWLLKRSYPLEAAPQSSGWLLKLLFWLKILSEGVWNRAVYQLGGVDSATVVYAGILRWGCRSGLPPIPSETPGEYGNRLVNCYPKLKQEIDMIVEAFNREIYGEIVLEKQALSRISAALRRMRSPRHWPSRMRTWFVQTPLQA